MPPAEMDTGRPGTGPQPAFHVGLLEARGPMADGARQGPCPRADPEPDHPHGHPELLDQGDRGWGPIIPRVGSQGLGDGPVGVIWNALILRFEIRRFGSRHGTLGVDARVRIDGLLADGAECPGGSRCRGGIRSHHGCTARAKLTSRGTSSRCSSAERLRSGYRIDNKRTSRKRKVFLDFHGTHHADTSGLDPTGAAPPAADRPELPRVPLRDRDRLAVSP
jgi:hypothetical protein